MNLTRELDTDALRTLLSEQDDLAGDHLLWVDRDGEVRLSLLKRGQSPADFERQHPEMQLRFEVFQRGNEYVGPDAAQDEAWIEELSRRLYDEWRQSQGEVTVAHVSGF
jgi:hypothetical protein